MSVLLLKFDDTTGDVAPVGPSDTIEAGQIMLDGVGGIALNAGACLLSNLADPMAPYDAATKGYVDGLIQAYGQGGYPSQDTTTSGSPGKDGRSILAGQNAPDNSIGNVGDLYIQLANGPYFWGPKATNGWPTNTVLLRGSQGDRGPAGVPGYSIRPSQSDPPPATLGNNGDYAISNTGILYGPKASGTYPTPGVALASQVPGPAGPGIRSSQSDPPSNNLGSDGDYAISGTALLYGPKNGGVWPSDAINLVGPKGDTGAGTQGQPGQRGASVLFSNVNPPNQSLGNNQDFAITFDGQLYGPKQNGAWGNATLSLVGQMGRAGADGQQGIRGFSVLQAQSDPPDNGLGLSYDFAISSSGVLYGPKPADGTWQSTGLSLIGPKGAASTTPGPMGYSIVTGNGAPSTQGNVGDVYVDVQNGNLYPAKATSGWGSTYTSLIGPKGNVGVQGLRGATITKFANYSSQDNLPTGGFLSGDFAITSDYFLFGPYSQSNGWPSVGVRLIGSQGVSGQAGATIRTSASTPDANLGNVGDYVFEQDNYQFIGPKNANGWPASGPSLRGPKGDSITGPKGDSVRGSQIYNGQGPPSNDLTTYSPYGPAQPGDLYFDTTNKSFHVLGS